MVKITPPQIPTTLQIKSPRAKFPIPPSGEEILLTPQGYLENPGPGACRDVYGVMVLVQSTQ